MTRGVLRQRLCAATGRRAGAGDSLRPVTEARLAEALALASSDDWEQRCAAVALLVGMLDHPSAQTGLLTLLLDEDNTAVTDEAAHALLCNGSPSAVAIFARGWLVADEDDTLPQMNDHLYDWAGPDPWPYDWPGIVGALRQQAESDDEGLREAARTLLADLPAHRFESSPAGASVGRGEEEERRRQPLSGTLTVEWMDAADPNDNTVPPNFGWFRFESDPPLEAPRLLALLRELFAELEEQISDTQNPWLGSRAPKG